MHERGQQQSQEPCHLLDRALAEIQADEDLKLLASLSPVQEFGFSSVSCITLALLEGLAVHASKKEENGIAAMPDRL
jgi:hypothetical protein